ncbi:MAG: TIGR03643 family protein [Bernardetiaceae bacterium]|jgi:uncharacterized protein (TIGR03643 family)|nr:TIGR03643 family protein [Bernardetiaceae bacterium]
MPASLTGSLGPEQVDRVIEMAWEDRTPFEAIFAQFQLTEAEVIVLMRRQLSPGAWRRWRARVQGRATKHLAKRDFALGRHKCARQRAVSHNKISKR